MMQHNNTANTLCALAIVFTSTKRGGCSLIRVCSLIRSNTVVVSWKLRITGAVISQNDSIDGRGHTTVGPGALANQIASFPFCADFDDASNERGRLAVWRLESS